MRVLVAMSGGVDSSVVAALLHEQGHEVVGATLQLYDHGAAAKRKGACCAGQDIHDAREVAAARHRPLRAGPRAALPRRRDRGLRRQLRRGETPIPCIRCNQTVKFHDLVELAARPRLRGPGDRPLRPAPRRPRGAELHRAADPRATRATSWPTPRARSWRAACSRWAAMASKAEVRAHAARLGLAVAEKPDSQDICFVPEGSYAEVVARHHPEAMQPGEIVDLEGRVLGRTAASRATRWGRGAGWACPRPSASTSPRWTCRAAGWWWRTARRSARPSWSWAR
jgi:tRNA-specific 2-thiouridylase